jgi:hypothetical protein
MEKISQPMNNDTHWFLAIVITAGIASIGWMVSKMFELAIRLRSEIHLVQERLIFFARQIHSPSVMKKELIREADRELRGLAASVRAAADAVLLYSVFSGLGIVPPKADVKEASALLIRLHNSLEPLGTELPEDVGKRNREDYDEVGKLLKIDLSTSAN